jgi:HSP20 family protein
MHHRKDPESQFTHLASRVERMWERLMEGSLSSGTPSPRPMEPPVDVYETDGAVVLVLEMAGIRDQQVTLDISGRRVLIQGERRAAQRGPGNRVYSQMEILCGPFRRAVTLPAPVEVEGAEVVYDDGFLRISFPKPQGGQERAVRIQVVRAELRRLTG